MNELNTKVVASRVGAFLLVLLLVACSVEGDSSNESEADDFGAIVLTNGEGSVLAEGGIIGSGGQITNENELLNGREDDIQHDEFVVEDIIPQLVEGGGDAEAITHIQVAGAALKGPFVVGSTILVNKLDGNANSTGLTIISEVQNSIGDFSFTVEVAGTYQIVATGYYFNEVSGVLSSGVLTLKSIHNVSVDGEQKAYVNVLTHLISNRVIHLVKEGITTNEAITQAQTELVHALYDVIPVENPENFGSLGLYVDDIHQSEWNGYLLALSVALYGHAEQLSIDNGGSADAELTRYLNVLVNDLADDGLLQTEGVVEDLNIALSKINVAEVIDNLMTRSGVDFESPLDVPDFTPYIKACYDDACVWSVSSTTLPTPMFLHSAVKFDDKIYVFSGGVVGSGYSQGVVFEYDLVTGVWLQKNDMPISYDFPEAFVVGDKIYIVDAAGTSDSLSRNNILEYNPGSDTWQIKSAVPKHRSGSVSMSANDKIYIFGGKSAVSVDADATLVFSNDVQIYDPFTDLWTTGTPPEDTFQQAAACTVGDDIYVLGGDGEEGDITRTNGRIYNTVNGTWQAFPDLIPVPASFFRCAIVNSNLYLLGLSTPLIYRDALKSWDRLPLPPAIAYGAAITVDNENIMVFGGVFFESDGAPSGVISILNTSVLYGGQVP